MFKKDLNKAHSKPSQFGGVGYKEWGWTKMGETPFQTPHALPYFSNQMHPHSIAVLTAPLKNQTKQVEKVYLDWGLES